MKILTTTGGELEITPSSYKPIVKISYSLKTKSDMKLISVDRGASTDIYSTELVITGWRDDVEAVYKALNDLRVNSDSVIITELEDYYFGDHVNVSGVSFDTLVSKITNLESKAYDTKSFKLTLLATDITASSSSTQPLLECLESGYTTTSLWNTHINSTYTNNNYMVDKEEDKYIFNGHFILTREENTQLYKFWVNQRGNSFTINDGDFGVLRMFGPTAVANTHNVVITEISYKIISPLLREVEIQLVKNDKVIMETGVDYYEGGTNRHDFYEDDWYCQDQRPGFITISPDNILTADFTEDEDDTLYFGYDKTFSQPTSVMFDFEFVSWKEDNQFCFANPFILLEDEYEYGIYMEPQDNYYIFYSLLPNDNYFEEEWDLQNNLIPGDRIVVTNTFSSTEIFFVATHSRNGVLLETKNVTLPYDGSDYDQKMAVYVSDVVFKINSTQIVAHGLKYNGVV